MISCKYNVMFDFIFRNSEYYKLKILFTNIEIIA